VYAISVDEANVVGGDDAAEAAWHDLASPPPLAFDHDDILADFKDRGHLTISKVG
jgi:hypothetical protein